MKKIATFEIDRGKVSPPEYYDKSFERAIPCVWISDEVYCGENHLDALDILGQQTDDHGFLINGKVYTRDETQEAFGFGDSSTYLIRAVLDIDTQLELASILNDDQKRYLAVNENLDPEVQKMLAEEGEKVRRALSENPNLIDELSFLKRGERMLRKTAEIFDYYKVTVKEAEDILDRAIDWAGGDNSIDGSDVDNIKDEIIELFKEREIPVEEALDILGGLSELISYKGMEGQAGMVTIPQVTAPEWMPGGVGGAFETWMNAPVLPGAVPAAGGSAAVSALELSAKPALTPAFEAGAEFISEQFPESFSEFIETTTPTSGTMPLPSSYNIP